MAKVLVTGGLGFIGSHLVDELVRERHEVFVCDIKDPEKISYRCKNGKAHYGYSWTEAPYFSGRRDIVDIRNIDHIFNVIYGFKIEYIFHCAALARIQPSFTHPLTTFNTNVVGTINLLDVAKACGTVKKFIYSASSSVYGNHARMFLSEDMEPRPLNPHADSKLMGEMLVKRYAHLGVPGVCLRYFNVYGPRQLTDLDYPYTTVIGKFLEQWKKGLPFTIVPDGNQRRDFTYISDVVRANILAMESDKVGKGEVINIGCGKNYSIFDVAEIIGGRDYPWELTDSRKGEAREVLANISKAKQLLDWEPKISFEEGIEILKNLKL